MKTWIPETTKNEPTDRRKRMMHRFKRISNSNKKNSHSWISSLGDIQDPNLVMER